MGEKKKKKVWGGGGREKGKKKTNLVTIRNVTIMLLANVQSWVVTCRYLRKLQVPYHPPVM
jgi:hypothetical protein